MFLPMAKMAKPAMTSSDPSLVKDTSVGLVPSG